MAGQVQERCESALDAVEEAAGDAVRGAMYYDGDDFGDVYFRDDVAALYSEEDKATAIDDFVLEALGDPDRLEDIYEMGALTATVRWFEDGFIVHVPVSEQSGFSISFDREAAAELEAILDAVEAAR